MRHKAIFLLISETVCLNSEKKYFSWLRMYTTLEYFFFFFFFFFLLKRGGS